MASPLQSSVDEGKDTLTIALDFGTTYSGIAYAYSVEPDKIYTISNWPGGEDRIAPKAPTTIQYEDGSKSSFKWGYQLDLSTGDKITALKLLLDPEQDRPYYIPDNVDAEYAKLPKPVVEVASDYIYAIFKHALSDIESCIFDRRYLDGFKKQFMLTVPAVWSDKAKDMTFQAARKAGISPVEMITEPEAASLYTLLSAKYQGLQAGDTIVVCDAGGGTVDLISYRILSGVCGSIMLNKRFEEEVRLTVGDEAYVKLKKTAAYRNAVKEFDCAIKPAFRGKDDADKFVSFPMARLEDNESQGLVGNSMVLSGSTMFRIFDPIIRDIDRLVSDQVTKVRMEQLQLDQVEEASVRAIFLVGGFGSSAFLKETIMKSNPGIPVIQPKEAWSAIVRGAVMSKLGLAPVVKATKAPKHFGTSVNSIWCPSRDHGQVKVKDCWDETDRCETMSWFVYKNDDLVRDEKVKLSFHQKWGDTDPRGTILQFDTYLFECDSAEAPIHPESAVKVNCVLRTDLSQVPASCFTPQKRPSDGADYFVIQYELIIENNASGLMKFSLEVDGKEYSAVQASY